MMDFPEPLFETYVEGKKLCLVCAKSHATSALRTVSKQIVPICRDCSADWNFYGYLILKRIKPMRLIRRILLFKLTHPFQQPSLFSIWRDVVTFKQWAEYMRKFRGLL